MTTDAVEELVEKAWGEAEQALEGLDAGGHQRLNLAVDALDAVWDRRIFDRSETFGGPEIRFARAVSAGILARLLRVEYVALASAGGSEIPGSGSETLDEALAAACQEALDTFSDELLGPVRIGPHLIYAQPMLLESPVPFGAVVLAASEELNPGRQRLLAGFLRHFDTRLSLAERLLEVRRERVDLRIEVKKMRGESLAPTPAARVPRVSAPENVESPMRDLARSVSSFDVFGVPLPAENLEEFCRNLNRVTNSYLDILSRASDLFLDVPTGINAKDGDKRSAPYLQLLEMMDGLREASRVLLHTSAEDLAPYAAGGRSPTFSDLTRIGKQRAGDSTIATVLDIMNDRGEDAELDALSARQHPYEFRVANTGEVFALLGLHETLKTVDPDRYPVARRTVLRSLPRYQAARAYLFSYDRFEDVPLKGVRRTEQPEAEKLLLYREGAPAFGVLLRAYSGFRG